MSGRGKVTVTLLITSVIALNIAGIFFFLDSIFAGPFTRKSVDIQNDYPTPFTPSWWVNNHWNAVFVWLGFLLIYNLFTMIRRAYYTRCPKVKVKIPEYLYEELHIGFIHPMVYASITATFTILLVYLFLWDMLLFRASVVLLLNSCILSHCAYYLLAHQLKHVDVHSFDYKAANVWLVRVLGLNGLGLLTSWLTFLCLLNLSVVAVYQDGGTPKGVRYDVGGKISCIFYTGWILVTLILDLFMLKGTTSCVIVHYVSAMVCGCGIVTFRPLDHENFPWIGFVITGLAGFAFVAKLTVDVWRHFKAKSSSGIFESDITDFQDFVARI